MIFKPSSLHKFFFTYICPRFYGDPPKMPSQPSTTTQNINSIPKQLMPYYKKMLNSAQTLTQDTYKPYSTDAADYVARFSPLQQQAQTSAAGLQVPGQFEPASQMTGMSGLGSMMAGQNYQNQATDPNSVGAYMSPYMQNVMEQQVSAANRQYDISGAQQQGQATQAGAFGGTREALMASENERNRNTAIGGIYATGLQNAYTAANANQQFGANLGLQGMGQGIQAAGQLGSLGTQQLAAQTGVINTQNTIGGQQQAQQQQAINQAILNYQNAQQYPYMQLGFMSDLLHGTQTGNTTQTQYQAQPGMASQIGGLAATGLGAYMASKANGGVIEDKGYKSGGIVGYKDRGYVEESMLSKLEDLDRPHLEGIIQKNESPEMTGLAKEVLATKLAKGGIVAFANNEKEVKDKNLLLKKRSDLQEQAAPVVNKTDMGIGAAPIELEAASGIPVAKPVVSTQTPVQTAGITPVQAATLGPMSTNESLKNMALNQAEGFKPPLQTSGIAAVKAPSVADKILAAQEENVAASEKEANKSVEERVKEIADLKEKMLGKDTETAEYRKSLMEEKANSKDELRRQMGMRLMEFGANWASTPGAPLVAGMKALKESLPSVMQDTKENKKLMKDIDKSIYLLNHSERLDAEGKIDAAAKARQDASGIVMANKTKLTDFAMEQYKIEENARLQEKQIEATLEGHRISAGAAVEAAKIRGVGGKNGIAALGAKITSNDKQILDAEKQLKTATILKDSTKIATINKTLSNLYKMRTYYQQMPAEIIDNLDDNEGNEDSNTFVPTEEQKAVFNKYYKKG